MPGPPVVRQPDTAGPARPSVSGQFGQPQADWAAGQHTGASLRDTPRMSSLLTARHGTPYGSGTAPTALQESPDALAAAQAAAWGHPAFQAAAGPPSAVTVLQEAHPAGAPPVEAASGPAESTQMTTISRTRKQPRAASGPPAVVTALQEDLGATLGAPPVKEAASGPAGQ